MSAAEFQKQPTASYAFDRWIWHKRVVTPHGDFTVQFQMGIGDTEPPDDEMVRRASELVQYAEPHGDYILGGGWVRGSGNVNDLRKGKSTA